MKSVLVIAVSFLALWAVDAEDEMPEECQEQWDTAMVTCCEMMMNNDPSLPTCMENSDARPSDCGDKKKLKDEMVEWLKKVEDMEKDEKKEMKKCMKEFEIAMMKKMKDDGKTVMKECFRENKDGEEEAE